ncbi:hypothetical protein AB0O76_40970 [Streptomyces sp. NPDC086554]|uniref:hypothetical protein n=1 Tax=Streptomyces sp. NPDC086554 TaxID=3154864 RepID=UPI00343310C9
MKMRTLAATGIVGAALLAGLTGGIATADTTGTTKAAAGGCSYAKLTAEESVKIRTKTRLDATAVGLLPKGKVGRGCDSTDTGQTGQSYKLCGERDNSWVYLSYAGKKGWVPTACIKEWQGA